MVLRYPFQAGYAIRCGHSRTVDLVGPSSERERKLAWYEGQDCPQCWGESKRAREASMPITMTIHTNGMDKDEQGNILAWVVLTGGTINHKDEIKGLGYFWGDVRGGVMDMLSTSRPDKAWRKIVRLLDLVDAQSSTIASLHAEAQQLSAKIVNGIDAMDIEMARQQIAKQQAVKDAVASIAKPARPECHPLSRHPGAKWNGTYYGSDRSGWSYYVANAKHTLTADEYAECMAYRKLFDLYKAQVEKIKKESK